MKKIVNDTFKSVVIASLLIVIGIALCISMQAGIRVVTWITGLVIIAYGVINIISALSEKKSLSVRQGLIGVGILVFGIFYIKYELISIALMFAPWLVAGVGVALIIDAVLAKAVRNCKNNKSVIIQLVVGILALVAALLVMLVPKINEFTYLIIGILLVVFGVYSVVKIALKKK